LVLRRHITDLSGKETLVRVTGASLIRLKPPGCRACMCLQTRRLLALRAAGALPMPPRRRL
jgi:hypothetical protein